MYGICLIFFAELFCNTNVKTKLTNISHLKKHIITQQEVFVERKF